MGATNKIRRISEADGSGRFREDPESGILVNKDSKIYIAGHTGMVGSSILRRLIAAGYSNLVFTPYPEYDLIDQKTVSDFFKKEQPEYVIDSAARVGGIQANNTYRAEFIYQNLAIQNNLIHSAYREGVKKFLFLGFLVQ